MGFRRGVGGFETSAAAKFASSPLKRRRPLSKRYDPYEFPPVSFCVTGRRFDAQTDNTFRASPARDRQTNYREASPRRNNNRSGSRDQAKRASNEDRTINCGQCAWWSIMTARFDLFQMEANGGVRWCESAATLEQAKARLQQLAALTPGQYLVLNQGTGAKLVFALDGTDDKADAIASS